MYSSEGAFVAALVDHLRTKERMSVTRIESHGTRLGIPDIHAVCSEGEFWIECKRIHKNFFIDGGLITVPFEAGQQKWAKDYREAQHNHKAVLLMVSFENWIASCSLKQFYEGKKIPSNHFRIISRGNYVSSLRDEWRLMPFEEWGSTWRLMPFEEWGSTWEY